MPFARIPNILVCDNRFWWAMLFLNQLSICISMVGCLLLNEWVELGPSGLMKGSLFKINGTSGSTDVNKYWHDYWKDNCDNDQWRDFGICKVIDSLYAGSIYMSVGEVLAILCLLLWTYSFFQWIYIGKGRAKSLHRPYMQAIAMIGFHYAGTIIWITEAKVKYSGSCDWDGTFSQVPDLCAKKEAEVALALMIVMPLVVVVFIVIFQAGYKELVEARNQAEINESLASDFFSTE
ncbi:unnamed protein product [Blepharisma stoltei]|uniref:G-protein coupled receptors family 2 profile 2 domain-containing protein n=1 Tax=Blepharisma stoltei TaxID=1481888 RepID=A0AAU9JZT3_9CILI|nr:unnamed protein product [Blepharisma stoltei]